MADPAGNSASSGPQGTRVPESDARSLDLEVSAGVHAGSIGEARGVAQDADRCPMDVIARAGASAVLPSVPSDRVARLAATLDPPVEESWLGLAAT